MKSELYLILILSFLILKGCHAQNKSDELINRKPYAAGKFYSANAADLKQHLKQLFSEAKPMESKTPVLAVIAPHAGYVFSGTVAATSYNQIDPDRTFKHIFILAPSHTNYFNGASIYCKGNYETPLGEVKVDIDFVNTLLDEHSVLSCQPVVHQNEHSIEVQLPFLQYHLKNDFSIVPVVIGNSTPKNCERLAAVLQPYFNDENLFVISSDFSHYPSYEDAVEVDSLTAKAIIKKDPDVFMQTLKKNEASNVPGLVTSACGQGPILTLLYIIQHQKNVNAEIMQYQNAGDSPYGDKEKVVGYYSIVFSGNVQHTKSETVKKTDKPFTLSTGDKKKLLEIARNTIEDYIINDNIPKVNEDKLSDNLKVPCGAFVTLHEHGNLRGCIGRFDAGLPLYQTVQQMAVAAATKDYRFPVVKKEEIPKLDIEISVLTPLKRIKSLDEFELGRDGIYIKKGSATGTFLPQVAEGRNWTKEEFVGYCSLEKAGLGYEGWKSAELYTYQALIFSEAEFNKK